MSDVEKSKRITELPFAAPLTGNEVLPVVQDGVTKQATPAQIASLATAESVGLGNVANLAPADLPISNATLIVLEGKAAVDHDHVGYVRATINEWD